MGYITICSNRTAEAFEQPRPPDGPFSRHHRHGRLPFFAMARKQLTLGCERHLTTRLNRPS